MPPVEVMERTHENASIGSQPPHPFRYRPRLHGDVRFLRSSRRRRIHCNHSSRARLLMNSANETRRSVAKQLHPESRASVSILRPLRSYESGGSRNAHAPIFLIALTFGALSLLHVAQARGDEYGFSTYGLGGSAFGAGQTPPPGTYVTYLSGFYEGKIDTAVTFGNVTVNAGAKVEFFQMAVDGLYVPDRKVLGGQPGFAVTIPVGHINIDASVTGPLGNTFNDETRGGAWAISRPEHSLVGRTATLPISHTSRWWRTAAIGNADSRRSLV